MRRRGGDQGAETLELVAGLPLLGLTVMFAWQGIILMRQQGEAESDAGVLGRAAVVCNPTVPVPQLLRQIDPQATGARVVTDSVDAHTKLHTVTVELVPQSVFPNEDLESRTDWRPRATVRMRNEC